MWVSRFLLLSLFPLLVIACSSGGGGGGSDNSSDASAPTADVTTSAASPFDPDLIPESTSIILTFSESMDVTVGGWNVAGDLASESDGGTWSNTNVQNDTLTISPSGEWFAKPDRQLIVNARDLAGNPATTLMLQYDIYRGQLYYVNIARADDNGDGQTPLSARKFIHTAIADATPTATILVATGSYYVNYSPDTRIWLRADVSVYGGYSTDFTSRDPAVTVSAIYDTTDFAATETNPNFAVIANDAAITNATVFDGFTVSGSNQQLPEYTAAIRTRNGAAPTIRNNEILGGGGDALSRGIYIDTSAALVENNYIRGGSGNYASCIDTINATAIIQNNRLQGSNNNSNGTFSGGLRTTNSLATIRYNDIDGCCASTTSGGIIVNSTPGLGPLIYGNKVHGGISNTTTGITIQLSNGGVAQIYNNMIYGGGTAVSNASYGILTSGSSAIIRNNTIHGGRASNSKGIRNSGNDAPLIDNNILSANDCIFREYTSGIEGSLRNNTFFNCGTALNDDDDMLCPLDGDGDGNPFTCSVAEVNGLAFTNGAGNNIEGDPMFANRSGPDGNIDSLDDNDWHLSAATPASVSAGGLNGNDEGWSFTDDFDGVMRPAAGNPWSIGAFEP